MSSPSYPTSNSYLFKALFKRHLLQEAFSESLPCEVTVLSTTQPACFPSFNIIVLGDLSSQTMLLEGRDTIFISVPHPQHHVQLIGSVQLCLWDECHIVICCLKERCICQAYLTLIASCLCCSCVNVKGSAPLYIQETLPAR